MDGIQKINEDYYNKLYRKRNILFQLIYPFVSYDQQCKSKYNISLINKWIKTPLGQSGFTVLDYGFGHGSLLLKFPKRSNLYGCDISKQAVTNFPKVARMVGKEVKTFLPEEAPQSIRNVKFHLITLSHVLEHIDDDKGLLKDLLQKMEDDGKLLINVPINEVWQDPKHVRKYSLAYMNRVAQECGLKIESWQEVERWSAFFLEMEMIKKVSRPIVFLMKLLRFLLALLPVNTLVLSEKLLPRRYLKQQLILLLSKR